MLDMLIDFIVAPAVSAETTVADLGFPIFAQDNFQPSVQEQAKGDVHSVLLAHDIGTVFAQVIDPSGEGYIR